MESIINLGLYEVAFKAMDDIFLNIKKAPWYCITYKMKVNYAMKQLKISRDEYRTKMGLDN